MRDLNPLEFIVLAFLGFVVVTMLVAIGYACVQLWVEMLA